MSTLATAALKMARARAVFDVCQEKLKRDPEYAKADKAWRDAYLAYGDAIKAIPDTEIRAEVDAAIKALLEISAGTSS